MFFCRTLYVSVMFKRFPATRNRWQPAANMFALVNRRNAGKNDSSRSMCSIINGNVSRREGVKAAFCPILELRRTFSWKIHDVSKIFKNSCYKKFTYLVSF
jgi:hypothetical protein